MTLATVAACLLLAAEPAGGAAPTTPPPSAGAPLPADAEARALAALVQSTYERTKDLEAAFTQTYTYAGFGRRQVSTGTLRVKKPGMMRWDYEKPAKKTVAVKGTRLVQYEPEENQAYVDERFDASAMSAAVAFLLGKGDLRKEFLLSVDPAGNLVLEPREADPRVQTITLTVLPDGEVRATRVVDGAGNVNEIRFDNVKRNRGLADAAFEVPLPKDVNRIAAPRN